MSERPPWKPFDADLRPLLHEALFHLPEKYRTAIVLCHLEGKSNGEAARQLGCPVGTLSARLTRGRRLLRKRLSRKGTVLSSAGLAPLLSHDAVSAGVPTALVRSTLRCARAFAAGQAVAGSVSGKVAALMEGAGAGTALSKFSLGAAILAVGFLAIGAGALARRDPPLPVPVSQATATRPSGDAAKQADSPDAQSIKLPPAGNVVVTGRVLDPDGKSIAGARLYYPRWPKTWDAFRTDPGEIENLERGVTGPDGRFRVELPAAQIRPDRKLSLVAAAPGYGVDGAELSKDKPAQLTLRLVKDQPIDGKILNTEGRPLSGVEVIVQGVLAFPQERLDEFLETWKRDQRSTNWMNAKSLHLPGKRITQSFITDKNGRFRIAGVGTERAVPLLIRAPAIAQAAILVVTRDGIDPIPYDRAVQNRQMPQDPNVPPILRGPKFTYVATPGRTIMGTVREAGSLEPSPRIVVTAYGSLGSGFRAVSDIHGKFEITGLPKRKTYRLHATPDANNSLMRRDVEVADAAGQNPIHVDIELTRGVALSGRLIDKVTGKGVRGFVQFTRGNLFEQESPTKNWTESRTDDAGSFHLQVLPGKGVLWGQASSVPCGVDGKPVQLYRRVRLGSGDPRMLAANFYEKLDVPEGASSLTRDLYVDPGKTVKVHVQDPDGKPLSGTMVVNLTDFSGNNEVTFAEPDCPVYALDPATPRRVLFYHATRNLIASLTLRGDEKEPPVARLVPAGAMTGRVLDRDAQPLVDADIYPRFQERSFDNLYWRGHEKQWLRTDRKGRFHLPGLPPNVNLRTLEFQKGRERLAAELSKKPARVAPGETLDLGDIHAKPQ
jgi:Sigma-70, region 4